jgi:hypothetical protein
VRGGEHGRRRRKIRLADPHVDDAVTGGLEGAGGRLHLHDVDRRDLVAAGGDADGKLRRRA